jgi:hypothetical protein
MKKMLLAVLAALTLVFGVQTQAQAAGSQWGTGYFTGPEYDQLTYKWYKSTVENSANVTGLFRQVITTNPTTYIYNYNNTWEFGGVQIWYYRTDSGSYRVYRTYWCRQTAANGDLFDCGPNNVWALP